MAVLREKGAGDKLVFVGGVIPSRDFAALRELGVTGIFPGGTPLQETIDFIRANVA
jgi:methylmalonyl-CoA mutase C-terminal domain/subunit